MTMPAVPSRASILVVDDEANSLMAMEQLLSGPDRSVVTARSGEEALRRILKTDFALILMDVRMPGMDGFEAAALIRKVQRSRHTPIIFLTAARDKEQWIQRGYEVGAVDYIVKPADPEVLRSKVAVFVGLSRASEDLEGKIRERSASLIEANERLRKEIEMRERAEAELIKAKQAAEAANLAKSEFLANMSHEIRTPMGAILGLTDLALRTELTEEQREYLTLVRASGESLRAIVSGILDFSKIEAGRLDIETVPFSLRECIGDTVKTLEIEARMKGVALACEIAPGTPDDLLGDPVRLRQILFNLVGNAIKFTERGSVEVCVRPESIDDGELVCYCAVRDTGIGIPEQKQAAVFAPFLQADTSTARVYGGTGLGLTISARLVEMMRGRIWLESEVGKGSTFQFTVRLGLQDGSRAAGFPASPALEPRERRRIEVLLIEDNAVNRRLAQVALEKAGHTVVAVDNGADGLQVLKRGGFDLVLMDVQMPRMDGIETTRAIREMEKTTGGHVPVIALTAHAMARDRDRCLQAGMDGYLVKPIQPDSLLEAVDRVHLAASCAPPPGTPQALDRAALLERIGADPQLLAEITEMFMQEAGKLLASIRAAIAMRDAGAFARTVHTLRGMLRNLAADAAEKLAGTLQSIETANDAQLAEATLDRLDQAVAEVKAALGQLAGEIQIARAGRELEQPASCAESTVEGPS